MEFNEFTSTCCRKTIWVFGIYRPPTSKANKLTDDMFTGDFTKMCSILNNKRGELVIIGDFNIHLDHDELKSFSKKINKLYSHHGHWNNM